MRKTRKRVKKIKSAFKPKLLYFKPTSKKLPFKANSFDYVVAMSILSLLGSEKKVKNLLKEFRRVLKPTGKIILDVNDQASDFSGKHNKIAKKYM